MFIIGLTNLSLPIPFAAVSLGLGVWLTAMLYHQTQPGNHRSRSRLKPQPDQQPSPLGLMEYSQDGALLHNYKKIIAVNSRLAAILGYSQQELLQRPLKQWLELIHQKDYEQIRKIYDRERDGEYNLTCFRRDNSLMRLQVIAKTIKVDHKPMRLLMVRDVTEPEANRESIQRYFYIDETLGHTPFEVDPIIGIALDIAQRKTGALSVAIGLIDERAEILTWKPEHLIGIPTFPLEPISLKSFDKMPERYALIRYALRSNQLLPNWQGPQHLYSIMIPLVLGKKWVGIMVIDQPITNEYNESMANFLKHLALRVVVRLDHAMNQERLGNYLTRIEILHQIDNTLAESLDYEAIIHVCVVGIQSLLESSNVSFYAYDEQKDWAVKESEQKASDERLSFPPELTLQPFSTLKYRLYHEDTILLKFATADEAEQRLLGELALQTLMVLPVKRNHQVIGFVMVGEGNCECEFDEHEIMLAKGVVTQTRFALERYQIIKSLHESQQIKSEMVHMASHDLRGPLVQINGYLELLRRSLPEASEDQQRYLASMERGIMKGRQLLDDILNLERVESHLPDTWEDLPILPIIRTVLHDIEPRIALKNQHLIVDLPDSLPWLTGSDIQLQQMFLNLIDNAIKYTPNEGSITVRGWCEDHDLVFEVQDTGYGIPEDKVPLLFQRFFRVQVPGTEAIPGTGLGLSLVKAIAQRHNGSVFVSSKLGVGSTFGCRLPFSL